MEDFGQHRTTPTSSTPKFSDDGVLVDANAGSFAERRASKRGTNGWIPTRDSPILPSPCLTIPSGISPTVLLDSPIMLLNTQGQSSLLRAVKVTSPECMDTGEECQGCLPNLNSES